VAQGAANNKAYILLSFIAIKGTQKSYELSSSILNGFPEDDRGGRNMHK
jgi:hypothetical protein